MLEPAGISGFEETVLRALLGTERRAVAELAEDLDAAPDAVRRAVRHLTDLGVVERDGSSVAALDPRPALQGAVRQRRAELDQLTRTVDELSSAFHDRAARGIVSRLIEPVEGRAAIAAKVDDMLARADEEVLAFDTPPYVVHQYGDADIEIELLSRRITCRAVYAAEVLDVPPRAERIRTLVELGEQARVVPVVPIKMIVVDRREVLLPLFTAGQGPQQHAVVVHNSGICDALVALFEAVWARGVPLFAPQGQREDGLPPEDRAILHLLNAGLKDDAIGRQLSLSERTVRRRVAEISERLGASTRFQIGAQAVRRGWI
ncbi:response regulator transcription factor [Actinospica durhamensis]|uniref:Response regulator transcription factor n=1 Tax=Actinospica durhamensis TaxID=1508375 RepID=A0A941ELQ1_9ACTN|nr:LuxR C-terminal-related transcriptional regulator [Actinospica durhamensis]MBR7833245.1 response regulator transcription factor [Actinospica durhamensis]